MEIYPSTVTAISTWHYDASGGASYSVDNSTKKLIIVGTKEQVNTGLTTLSFQPGLNYIQNFSLYYHLSIAGGSGGLRPHNVLINNASAVVTLNELTNPGADQGLSFFDANTTHALYNSVSTVEIDPAFDSNNMNKTTGENITLNVIYRI